MAQTFNGSFLPTVIVGNSGIELAGQGFTRTVSVPTRSALNIFNKIAIRETNLATDTLGLYSFLKVGSDKKARIASMRPGEHLLRARTNGCAWSPSGKIRLNTDVFDTCPVEYMGEECPDALWGDCLEGIFGTANNNDVRNLQATAETQGFLQLLLDNVYTGLGNSFSALYNFANSSIITTSDTSALYLNNGTSPESWAAYKAQQMDSGTCAGIVTILDGLKSQGVPQFNVNIPTTDISANGDYTGDIADLIAQLEKNAKPVLKTMIKNGYRIGTRYVRPILLLTDALFRALEDFLISTGANAGVSWDYTLMREDPKMSPMPGVLKYKGMYAVRWDECGTFDAITGVESHRATIVAPGGFGMAYDVDSIPLSQFDGFGLVVTQQLAAPFLGKMYMHTTFRWGAAVVDMDYVVSASTILNASTRAVINP